MYDLISELRGRLKGIELHTDPIHRYSYGYDATGRKGECLGVLYPRDPGDLSRIVSESARLGMPLFMRGAGTGFSGGAVPVGGGIVVSTEKMRKVLSFDQDSSVVEVESGLVNRELQDYLEERGFFYPPDPASLKVSTIGGNIAENAGGPRAYKYGVTRRYVRSLVWITPGGDMLETPAEGLGSLPIGAEGTLGVIYSARLSVLPLPGGYRTSLLASGGDAGAMKIASELLSEGFCPSVMEFIDAKTMRCVSEYRRIEGLDSGTSYLFLETDGSPDELASQEDLLERFCGDRGLFRVTTRDDIEREVLWELRRSVSPSLARKGITKINEDVSLPLGSLPEAVSSIHEEAERQGLDCYIFGHCGDGNLHVNIMTDRRRRGEIEKAEEFVEWLFGMVSGMGGTLSGEHGIGITKNRYLEMLFSPEEISLQKGIKGAVDPTGYLNPGKYFSGI